ncbi:phage head closure protein [Bacillus amyloliquefaciens]|uniref:phage head closure protein n=1 Tax=Bacillus amyloliquefaciens TaxID=1390 RepID=UPI003D2F1595
MVRTLGINPGKLRNRISIEKRQSGQDPVTMKPKQTWAPFAKPWAEIMQPRDRWIIQAAAEHQQNTIWFRIRQRNGIEAGSMRVIFKGQPYKITEVIPDLQTQELMTLQCEGWDREDIS